MTQLFQQGQIINLHPWEHNEVAPCLAAALQTDAPIVALHLTRPAVQIPDRAVLGMASYMDADNTESQYSTPQYRVAHPA